MGDSLVVSEVTSPKMSDSDRTEEFLDSLVGANPTLRLPHLPTQEMLVMFEQWLHASSREEHEASQEHLFSDTDTVTYEKGWEMSAAG
ncbi:PREDICTED: uncharacterized protein LOC104827193 isoform X3 [Tarenaya hassleriana]|uniref:uncharacterized protein LOC104827193 isoform X2 n=1 Tax=Tarenaya hassleriana TaxID=28532 RepID=UPI00053C928C|nr:PREDICTED: uncharacterized protein LOC104827193 isoform X2 [Tarenaya hassleriana]XP_010558627.1 PREDICTED: uncharacterized protein LOC104827193 isoform X3 [Tarenaya hassleriana]